MGFIKNRSLGLKLMLLGVIILMLGIPLALISILSWERTARADEAVAEVSRTYGGAQTLRGPFLVLPYTTTHTSWREIDGVRTETERFTHGALVLSPETLAIDAEQNVEMRHRSIYEVPVYSTAVTYQARFQIPADTTGLPDNSSFDEGAAELVFGLADLRAIHTALEIELAGIDRDFDVEPGSRFDNAGWRGVTARIGELSPGRTIDMVASLGLNGASRLQFTPAGKETRIALQSDWPHPGFQGGFLPVEREILESGYSAVWTIPYLARGVPGSWLTGDRHPASLDQIAFGVDLVTPADGYQQVARSLKYALFFIGLVMLMFFLVEANSGIRIHPAQYILAGMAQVVFYLLLLAISEHAGVPAAFTLATIATVGLTGFYAMTMFASRKLGLTAGMCMAIVYVTQYVLILMEDYALLIGSLLTFGGLAVTMIVTRRIDWYENRQAPGTTSAS